MTSECKKFIQRFFQQDEIKEAIEKDNWDKVIKYFDEFIMNLDWQGEFIDLLIKATIPFTNYMIDVPTYAFFRSTLLTDAYLKNCRRLGSKCFRLANIKNIYLSKNSLQFIGASILSGVNNKVVINWDGTYHEWEKVEKDNKIWFNYNYVVSIKCIDGLFNENITHK